ncbi:MAG: response regulator [Clostridiales bacterium]|jgi:YesN/AraC family two-component response regulator|nr:response regulator [Clostridiales bacterium]MDR2752215.1 response regulator [Clostridiales bacterium]
MYRLIIVDDNKFERNGIKKSIEWEKYGIMVVGTFANGYDALASLDELQPHIVITDIAMPNLNGIEMSEIIKKKNPGTKIIFISCHSDFNYSQSAISLGANGYVLKPIVSDELVVELEKIVNDFIAKDTEALERKEMMRQLEEMLPLVQEQFFKELLLGNCKDREDIGRRVQFLRIPVQTDFFAQVIFISLRDLVNSGSAESSYFVSYSVKRIVSSASMGSTKAFPVQISSDEFAAVIFGKTGELKEAALSASVCINMEISGQLGISATMGISKCASGLENVPLLYRQAFRAANTRFYSGSNPIILFEDIEEGLDSPFEGMPNMDSVYQDLRNLVSLGTEESIEGFLQKYLGSDGMRRDEIYIKGFVFSVISLTEIILKEANQSFKDVFGDDIMIWKKLSRFETIIDVKQWLCNIFRAIQEHISKKSSSRNARVVESIKEIIKNSYSEQISIDAISKSVYLSGRHINSLFKKETGKTIFDYVISYRIEVAKRLLKDPDSKVSAVAESVGYQNTSYFCLAFKKNVGMTPAEYKNKANL